jgi:hypothetical protein
MAVVGNRRVAMFALQKALVFLLSYLLTFGSSFNMQASCVRKPRIARQPGLIWGVETELSFRTNQLTRTFAEENSTSDGPDKFTVADSNEAPQGYMSSDLSSMDDSKQKRVLAYIVLALAPVLLLVPFFLSRDFVPPVETMTP